MGHALDSRRDRRPLDRLGNAGAVSNARRALDRESARDRSVDRMLAAMTARHRTGAPASAGRGDQPSSAPHDHVVAVYGSDRQLRDEVMSFVLPALQAGEAVVLVATAGHRDRFLAAIDAAGVDVGSACRRGQLQALDASILLASLLVDGRPSPPRVESVVGGLLDRAVDRFGAVKVYGEMVALLWADGREQDALGLEDLWNDLARSRRFSLSCAYPAALFDEAADTPAYRSMCARHSAVVQLTG